MSFSQNKTTFFKIEEDYAVSDPIIKITLFGK